MYEQLIPLSEYLPKKFANPPPLRTARRWCDNGNLPAKKIGKLWFVDLAKEIPSGDPSVDDLVNRVLRAS